MGRFLAGGLSLCLALLPGAEAVAATRSAPAEAAHGTPTTPLPAGGGTAPLMVTTLLSTINPLEFQTTISALSSSEPGQVQSARQIMTQWVASSPDDVERLLKEEAVGRLNLLGQVSAAQGLDQDKIPGPVLEFYARLAERHSIPTSSVQELTQALRIDHLRGLKGRSSERTAAIDTLIQMAKALRAAEAHGPNTVGAGDIALMQSQLAGLRAGVSNLDRWRKRSSYRAAKNSIMDLWKQRAETSPEDVLRHAADFRLDRGWAPKPGQEGLLRRLSQEVSQMDAALRRPPSFSGPMLIQKERVDELVADLMNPADDDQSVRNVVSAAAQLKLLMRQDPGIATLRLEEDLRREIVGGLGAADLKSRDATRTAARLSVYASVLRALPDDQISDYVKAVTEAAALLRLRWGAWEHNKSVRILTGAMGEILSPLKVRRPTAVSTDYLDRKILNISDTIVVSGKLVIGGILFAVLLFLPTNMLAALLITVSKLPHESMEMVIQAYPKIWEGLILGSLIMPFPAAIIFTYRLNTILSAQKKEFSRPTTLVFESTLRKQLAELRGFVEKTRAFNVAGAAESGKLSAIDIDFMQSQLRDLKAEIGRTFWGRVRLRFRAAAAAENAVLDLWRRRAKAAPQEVRQVLAPGPFDLDAGWKSRASDEALNEILAAETPAYAEELREPPSLPSGPRTAAQAQANALGDILVDPSSGESNVAQAALELSRLLHADPSVASAELEGRLRQRIVAVLTGSLIPTHADLKLGAREGATLLKAYATLLKALPSNLLAGDVSAVTEAFSKYLSLMHSETVNSSFRPVFSDVVGLIHARGEVLRALNVRLPAVVSDDLFSQDSNTANISAWDDNPDSGIWMGVSSILGILPPFVHLQFLGGHFNPFLVMGEWAMGSFIAFLFHGSFAHDRLKAKLRGLFLAQAKEFHEARKRFPAGAVPLLPAMKTGNAISAASVKRPTFPGYQIKRIIKEGGMGRIYEVVDESGAKWAMKEFLPSQNAQETKKAFKMFKREFDVLLALNEEGKNPHIPTVTGFHKDIDGGRAYFAMEFVEGENLYDRYLKTGKRMDADAALNIAEQILETLEYLHTRKDDLGPILFGDLKPENVIVRPDGTAVLVDFGLAHKKDDSRQMHGTPGYAPPEQYGGTTDERSDLYSFAATLYAVLVNFDPSRLSEPKRGYQRVIRAFPAELNPSAPDWFRALIMSAVDPDPRNRPASAKTFLDAIRASRAKNSRLPRAEVFENHP